MSLLTEKIELDIQEGELAAKNALSDLPPLVRWGIIILVVAIIPSYFIAKSVAFNIWQARYKQGAITAKPSFTNPVAPKTSNVFLTTIGPGQYAAAVKITNPNLDLSLDNIPYEVDFLNSQKQQIYNYKDTLFLLPNQSKYLVVPTFSVTDQITYTSLVLPQTLPWQKRLQIPQVSLITSLPTTFTQNSPQAFVVQGDVYNNSPYALSKVRLTFIIFDTSGNIIGTSQRIESTFAPFERRTYKQLWPNVAISNLGGVSVAADTDTLDSSNLSVPAPQTNSASDLSRPK
jgi:hypothetical protein